MEYGAIVELHNLEELAEFGEDMGDTLLFNFFAGGNYSDGSITIYDGYME